MNCLAFAIMLVPATLSTPCSPGSWKYYTSSEDFVLFTAYGYNTVNMINLTYPPTWQSIAGSSSSGTAVGVGKDAMFAKPSGISIAPDGKSALIFDELNTLKKIDLNTRDVTMISGIPLGAAGPSIIQRAGSSAYISFANTNRILKVTEPGAVVTSIFGDNVALGSSDGILTDMGSLNTGLYFISPDETFFLVLSNADKHIRKLDIATNTVKTIAGSPGALQLSGCSNGAGTNARFYNPNAVQMTDSNTAYISDIGSYNVRRLAIDTGIVYPWIGNCDALNSEFFVTNQAGAGTNALFGFHSLALTSDKLSMFGMTTSNLWRINMEDTVVSKVMYYSFSGIFLYFTFDVFRKSDGTCIPCSQTKYCPEGTELELPCPLGSYCPTPGVKIACSPGYACRTKGLTAPNVCFYQYYCPDGYNQTKCKSGSYCPNLATSEEPCPAGYYCPSISDKYLCANGDYCPPRTLSNEKCPAGFYCKTPSEIAECSPGITCPAGSNNAAGTFVELCHAGSYCPTPGISIFCDIGTYCPTDSTSPLPCPEGFYCPTTDTMYLCFGVPYCPARSIENTQCTAGYYCPNSTSRLACDGIGQYCPIESREIMTCPAGYYCKTPAELQICLRGTYCPAGSVNSLKCSESGTYCPVGSISPSTCPAGSYCETSESKSWCGLGTLCPAGSTAPIPCPLGSYCTDSLTQATCTGVGVYCPLRSTSPGLCPGGSFCPSTILRQLCPRGFYCQAGSMSATLTCNELGTYCPLGSESPVTCPAGSFCPSTDTRVPCSRGTYSIAVGATTISTCEPCTAGSFCPTPVTKIVCPAGSFCPSGVSAPTRCPIGSFCPSGSSAAVSCPTPSSNHNTGTQSYTDCTCPAGMFGRVSSAVLAVCTTCPIGQVCIGTPITCSCTV